MSNPNSFPTIRNPNLPEWRNPFSVGYDFTTREDNTFRAELEADMRIMAGNVSRMLASAEEDWYLKLVIEVLRTKGYTVTKEANRDRDI